MQPWQLQSLQKQMHQMNQMIAATGGKGHAEDGNKSKGKGKGKGGKASKGGSKGAVAGKGGGHAGNACFRCGYHGHAPHQCSYLTNGAICPICGNEGHSEAMCKKKASNLLCGCCGQAGHMKKNCPHKDHRCSMCNKSGHYEIMCWDLVPGGLQAAPVQPAKNTVKPAHVTENLSDWTWQCGTCAALVKDEADTAIKCPKCKADKTVDSQTDAKKHETYMDAMLKNTSRVLACRLQDIQKDGTMELPQDEKAAVERMKVLESEILAVGQIASFASAVEERKKELALLKKKYPEKDLAARDYALYIDTVADVEQKAATRESLLMEKLAKQKETFAKLQPDSEALKKKMKEELERNLTALDNKLKQNLLDHTAAIKETEDSIKAHTEATQAKLKDMERKAVPLTQKVAAATIKGDPAILKLDKQYTMVTSESIKTEDLENYLLANGSPPELCKTMAALMMGFMNIKSMVMGPAPVPIEQPPASSQATPAAAPAAPVVATTDMDTGDQDGEMTDDDLSESDEELKLANEEGDPQKTGVKKKTKTMTKKEKKARKEQKTK